MGLIGLIGLMGHTGFIGLIGSHIFQLSTFNLQLSAYSENPSEISETFFTHFLPVVPSPFRLMAKRLKV